MPLKDFSHSSVCFICKVLLDFLQRALEHFCLRTDRMRVLSSERGFSGWRSTSYQPGLERWEKEEQVIGEKEKLTPLTQGEVENMIADDVLAEMLSSQPSTGSRLTFNISIGILVQILLMRSPR